MRIFYLGASDIGWECCRMLLESDFEIVGILSIPQEFRISWSSIPVVNVRYKGFEDLAKTNEVPLFYMMTKMSDPLIEETIRRLAPDLILVVGWYYMVPRRIRRLAPFGAVGLHTSLLPRFRGGAPLVWAMIKGESRAGVSLFYLEDGVDEGDVITQQDFPIAFEEDIADIIRKAQITSVNLMREYLPLLAEGKAPRLKQDPSQATLMPQRKPEDGNIRWHTQSAIDVYNWVRAQTRPYPGAFTHLFQENLTIWKSRLCQPDTSAHMPGSVVSPLSSSMCSWGVGCADGRLLEIIEVGLPNGQTMSGPDYARLKGLPSRGHVFVS